MRWIDVATKGDPIAFPRMNAKRHFNAKLLNPIEITDGYGPAHSAYLASPATLRAWTPQLALP